MFAQIRESAKELKSGFDAAVLPQIEASRDLLARFEAHTPTEDDGWKAMLEVTKLMRELEEKLGVEFVHRIYLQGSLTDGAVQQGSDVDVVVEIKKPYSFLLYKPAYRYGSFRGILVDQLPWPRDFAYVFATSTTNLRAELEEDHAFLRDVFIVPEDWQGHPEDGPDRKWRRIRKSTMKSFVKKGTYTPLFAGPVQRCVEIGCRVAARIERTIH